jgi:uncharacterized membrane protein YhhN
MKKTIISTLYFLTGLLSIIFLQKTSFLPGFIFKALLIPFLMILFFMSTDNSAGKLHKFFFAGLFFSWAGDILLEFHDEMGTYFILGLGCFLIAHIMYLTVFLSTAGENTIKGNGILLVIPVFLYLAILMIYLYPHLGEMRLPVIIYAIVILSMLAAAINRKAKVSKISFYLVLAGAVLFVISDSAIAVNKFGNQFEYSDIIIMSTYILAQYLILKGYLAQYKLQS